MKKLIIGVALLALVTPAFAGGDNVSVTAEVWSRTEYLENHTDFHDTETGSAFNDTIDFTMYRARVDLNVEISDDVGACVEVQNFGVWGNSFPFDQQSQDPLIGTGDLQGFGGSNAVELYQGFFSLANIGGSNLSLKIGRQEHTLGNELHMGDNDFYGGHYFDGIRGSLDFESWVLDFFYYKIAERSVPPGSLGTPGLFSNGGSDDGDLSGVTAKFDLSEGHTIEPYLLYKRDGNEGGSLSGPKYGAFTLGALYDHAPSDDSMLDWAFEIALQNGEVDGACPGPGPDCDLSSYIAEGHFGVSFGNDREHRARVGVLFIGDGDDTMDREDFMHLFPDTHRRAGMMDIFSEFGSTDFGADSFHNLTNIFIDWTWMRENHGIGVALHQFTATEDFGAPEDDLGQEFDVWYTHDSGEHVNLHIGVGMFMPGDVFVSPDDETALRAFAMLRVRS